MVTYGTRGKSAHHISDKGLIHTHMYAHTYTYTPYMHTQVHTPPTYTHTHAHIPPHIWTHRDTFIHTHTPQTTQYQKSNNNSNLLKMGKGYEQTFLREDIQMSNRCMKNHSAFWTSGKCKLKPQ